MRKLLLLLIMMLAFGLTACGGGESVAPEENSSSAQTAEATEEADRISQIMQEAATGSREKGSGATLQRMKSVNGLKDCNKMRGESDAGKKQIQYDQKNC